MIQVKIDAFEGPLDLLLHLIEKAEVDIYDISIAEITNQYITYLTEMQELQLDIASEFLVMAATLLALKSKMLLPKQEKEEFDPSLEFEFEEINSREELIERILEYKKYKYLANQLREKEILRSKIFTRPAENLSIYLEEENVNPVANVSLFHLMDIFQQVLYKRKEEPTAKIERDEISIEEKMVEITSILARQSKILFIELLQNKSSRSEVVATFLAILELIKNKVIVCQQERLFDDIWILRRVGDESDEP